MVLQSDLLFAEQRSGTLSIGLSVFLIAPALSLFAFGTNSSQTGLSSPRPPAHYPREKLCTFPRKKSSFSSPCPRAAAARSPPQEEMQSLQNNSRLLRCHIYREPSPTTVGPRGTNSSGCLLPGRKVASSGKSSKIKSAPLELMQGENRSRTRGKDLAHQGLTRALSPAVKTPAHKPTFCQENKPGREDHAAHNSVTPTRPGNKELELNGISESISFPFLAVVAALTHAGQQGWRRGTLFLDVDPLSDQC